jgi:hypothetical protein
MKQARTRLIIWGAVAGTLCVGYLLYSFFYAGPRDKLLTRRDGLLSEISRVQQITEDDPKLRKELKSIAETTLGKQMDVVSHRFRSYTARLVGEAGLENVVVEQGRPADEKNPIGQRMPSNVPSTLRTAAREQVNMSVIRGAVTATGNLEQVGVALATLRAQPWIHRIEGVQIRPNGSDRQRFNLRVELATLYLPDLVATDREPTIAAPSEDQLKTWRTFASRNIFREPKPKDRSPGDTPPPIAVVESASESASPQPVVAPDYASWRLTGVVTGSRGTEAFFYNAKTTEKLTVRVGGTVLDATLVSADGESAQVEIAGKRFRLNNGDSLAARQPASR